MNTVIALRLTLSVLLLIEIYQETGPWTTLALFAIYVMEELRLYRERRQMRGILVAMRRHVDDLTDGNDKLNEVLTRLREREK